MTRPPGWPEDVEPIRIGDLARLGIDKTRQLYWDGEKIEIRCWLDLTNPKKSSPSSSPPPPYSAASAASSPASSTPLPCTAPMAATWSAA